MRMTPAWLAGDRVLAVLGHAPFGGVHEQRLGGRQAPRQTGDLPDTALEIWQS